MEKGKNVILNKSFDFACDILDLNEQLIGIRHFQLANQVIKSGTSIGANVTEMIAEIVVARKLETTGHQIIKSVHPHPTMSEAIMEATAAA